MSEVSYGSNVGLLLVWGFTLSMYYMINSLS
jgi:hypothetical protein